MRRLISAAALLLGLSLPQLASAGPASGSASAGASTSGQGSASSSGTKRNNKKKGYELPDFVYGGNAVSFISPAQVGAVGFVPRVRLGLQYDRQLHKHHWVHIGAAALLDRGNYRTFRMDGCGFDPAVDEGTCESGTVAGLDAYAGYTYKIYVAKAPWLVPYVRVGLGGGFWKYPNIGGTREQIRVTSWTLNLQAGGGVRIFLTRDVALGLDLNMRPGFVQHIDDPKGGGTADREKPVEFLLPFEILPVLIEYRF